MSNTEHYILCRLRSSELKKFRPAVIHPFGWEGLDFFVHRPITTVLDGIPVYSAVFWVVTSVDTGMSLPVKNATTIEEAKRQAVDVLNGLGIDKVKEAIERGKQIEVKV